MVAKARKFYRNCRANSGENLSLHVIMFFFLQSTIATEEVKGDDDPPEDAFLMVTQQRWEDKILWDTPYTPGPAYTGAGTSITHSLPLSANYN